MTDQVAPKRSRSNSNGDTEEDMSVAELANLLKAQLAENQRNTKEDMDKMQKALTRSLTKRIDTLETDLRADITKLREDTTTTFREIRATIDKTNSDTTLAFDRTSRSKDLIVSGVPYVHGENLTNYYSQWCRILGFADNFTPLAGIRRLVKGTPSDGTVYIILIQFAIPMHRDEFYGRYMKTRALSLSQLGFTTDKRIYVNENIGPAARTVRAKALALKKNGKLSGVFTKDGIVYVRKNANDRDEPVLYEDDLDKIVKHN